MNLNTFLQLIPNLFLNTAITFLIFHLIVELFLLFPMRSHWKFMFRLLPFLKISLNLFLYRLGRWTVFQSIDLNTLEENSRNLSAYIILRDWNFTSGLEFKIEHGKGLSFGLFDLLSSNWPPCALYILALLLLAFSCFKLICFFKKMLKTSREYKKKFKPYPTNKLSENIQVQLLKKRVTVEVLESQNTSPYAIGYWKPKIRLPSLIDTDLTQKEIDAVILHELAHIQRLDLFLMPLIHFLQALIPCISLTSLLLTQEKACDEKVIRNGGSRIDLVTALKTLSLKTQIRRKLLTSSFILKSQTFNRIHNLTSRSSKRPQLGLDIIYTILLTLISLFILTSRIGYF